MNPPPPKKGHNVIGPVQINSSNYNKSCQAVPDILNSADWHGWSYRQMEGQKQKTKCPWPWLLVMQRHGNKTIIIS